MLCDGVCREVCIVYIVWRVMVHVVVRVRMWDCVGVCMPSFCRLDVNLRPFV